MNSQPTKYAEIRRNTPKYLNRNSFKSIHWFGYCTLIYLLLLYQTSINAQSAAQSYADSMLQSTTGQTMVANISSGDTVEITQAQLDAHAEDYVYQYFLMEHYGQDSIFPFCPDSTDPACGPCYNNNFTVHSNQFIAGWKLYDGLRPSVESINECNADEAVAITRLSLPTHSHPENQQTSDDYYFDFIHDNHLSPASLPATLGEQKEVNYNTFNLISNGLDPVIPDFLQANPPSGNRSIRLGNVAEFTNDYPEPNFHVNSMRRQFYVGETDEVYTFAAAFVLENPEEHYDLQPFFTARFYNENLDVVGEYCYVAAPQHPATQYYTVHYAGEEVERKFNYKDWTCESFDLTPFQGEFVTVEFMVADCGFGGHGGYAYVSDICEPCEVDTTPHHGLLQIDTLCNGLRFSGVYCPPSDYEFQRLDLEFWHDGELRFSVLVTDYDEETCAFSYLLTKAQIEALSPQGGYDAYAVLYFENDLMQNRWIKSTSFIPNLKDVNEFIHTDNDFESDQLTFSELSPDLDLDCFGVECVGNPGGKPTYYFKAEKLNDLGAGFSTIESSLHFDGADHDLDHFISNATYLIQMEGFITITDPSIYDPSGFTINGSILITDGTDTCEVRLNLHICCPETIACQQIGVDCSNDLVDMDQTFYADVTTGQQNDQFTLHVPIELPFLEGDECTITQWTVTVFLVTDDDEVYSLTPVMINNPTSSTPYIHLDTLALTFNQTGLFWDDLNGMFVSFVNNCGHTCVYGEFGVSFDEVDDNGGKRLSKTEDRLDGVKFQPNPVRDMLKISRPKAGEVVNIQLRNLNGTMLKSTQMKRHQKTVVIQTVDVPSGTYLVRYSTGDQSVIKKIVIAH